MGQFELLVSAYIFEATARVWQTPYWFARFPANERTAALLALERLGTLVEVTSRVSNVATHAEDDLVLSVAVSGEADFLVTGDKALLALGQIGATPIVTVNEFESVLRLNNGESRM